MQTIYRDGNTRPIEKKRQMEGRHYKSQYTRKKIFLRYQSIDKALEEQTSTVKQEYTDE